MAGTDPPGGPANELRMESAKKRPKI